MVQIRIQRIEYFLVFFTGFFKLALQMIRQDMFVVHCAFLPGMKLESRG
jgi:hypothetical protein